MGTARRGDRGVTGVRGRRLPVSLAAAGHHRAAGVDRAAAGLRAGRARRRGGYSCSATVSGGSLLPQRALRPGVGAGGPHRSDFARRSAAGITVGPGPSGVRAGPRGVQPRPAARVRDLLGRLDQLVARRDPDPRRHRSRCGPALFHTQRGDRPGLRRVGDTVPAGLSPAGVAGRLDRGDGLAAVARPPVRGPVRRGDGALARRGARPPGSRHRTTAARGFARRHPARRSTGHFAVRDPPVPAGDRRDLRARAVRRVPRPVPRPPGRVRACPAGVSARCRRGRRCGFGPAGRRNQPVRHGRRARGRPGERRQRTGGRDRRRG